MQKCAKYPAVIHMTGSETEIKALWSLLRRNQHELQVKWEARGNETKPLPPLFLLPLISHLCLIRRQR